MGFTTVEEAMGWEELKQLVRQGSFHVRPKSVRRKKKEREKERHRQREGEKGVER